MGRKPRIEYYGAIYHIIQRGHKKKPIFVENRDKEKLLEILSEVKDIFDFRLYAYVIMDDHYHFLIRTLNIPISKIMHRLNTNYARYYNTSRDITGSVFKGRYKSILIEDESYLLELIRYIHSNPIADQLSKNMEAYKWSSDMFYRANVSSIVDINLVLDIFSSNRSQAIESYIDFMGETIGDYANTKSYYEKGIIVGSNEFKARILNTNTRASVDLDYILKLACPKEEDFNLIKAGSRKRYLTKYKKKYVELARKSGYSYEKIGSNIGVTRASIRSLFKS